MDDSASASCRLCQLKCTPRRIKFEEMNLDRSEKENNKAKLLSNAIQFAHT
jgi:hypothetical protein